MERTPGVVRGDTIALTYGSCEVRERFWKVSRNLERRPEKGHPELKIGA